MTIPARIIAIPAEKSINKPKTSDFPPFARCRRDFLAVDAALEDFDGRRVVG
jgi:hypothetical protein